MIAGDQSQHFNRKSRRSNEKNQTKGSWRYEGGPCNVCKNPYQSVAGQMELHIGIRIRMSTQTMSIKSHKKT